MHRYRDGWSIEVVLWGWLQESFVFRLLESCGVGIGNELVGWRYEVVSNWQPVSPSPIGSGVVVGAVVGVEVGFTVGESDGVCGMVEGAVVGFTAKG